jgi:hypothetical protein
MVADHQGREHQGGVKDQATSGDGTKRTSKSYRRMSAIGVTADIGWDWR